MSKQHPFEGEPWVQDLASADYYAKRQRGNYLILLAILAFIAFTLAMTIWNFSTGKFQRDTRCYEALKESDIAAQETYCNPQELAHANADSFAS